MHKPSLWLIIIKSMVWQTSGIGQSYWLMLLSLGLNILLILTKEGEWQRGNYVGQKEEVSEENGARYYVTGICGIWNVCVSWFSTLHLEVGTCSLPLMYLKVLDWGKNSSRNFTPFSLHHSILLNHKVKCMSVQLGRDRRRIEKQHLSQYSILRGCNLEWCCALGCDFEVVIVRCCCS